ncbi:NDR1/HIN1-like protein 13 [Cardamine amara subsp. amara]|uniref:NDR1/HIN1-like protein 13 n=1 Tax=Cardamine amara subsp. amara TaxID=228776 RepID=A0ABD0Z6I9_CARAN
MERSTLPPTSTSTANDNENKHGDPPSTCHRPTSSLPQLPSPASQVSSPPNHFRNHSLNHFPHLSSSSSPPPPPPDPIPEIETYVVQVPRDQVYWTPPPENAKILERRRNSEPTRKNKRFCSKRCKLFFIAAIVIGVLICLITLIVGFLFKPEPPVFNVKKLGKPHHFEILLTSKNPSSDMWVTYKGLVSLTYKNKNVGQGNFPELSLAVSGSHTINLELEGSKNAALLPPEVVSLVLTMELNAGFGTGLVKRAKEVAVTCDVKVKGLLDAHKVEIVSESCESEFTH